MNKRITLAAFTILLSSCSSSPDMVNVSGAALGSLGGAALGHQLDDKKGKEIGAALGAIAGAMIADYMQKQQQSIAKALEEQKATDQIEVEKMEDETLKLNLKNEVTFGFDSSEIQPEFEPTLSKLAGVLAEYKETIAHIIGYTDNDGSSEYNRLLSQKRAESIAKYFASHDVDASRIKIYGLGDKQPRASNETEEGRSLNRRVEIFIKPIVQGREKLALEFPRY